MILGAGFLWTGRSDEIKTCNNTYNLKRPYKKVTPAIIWHGAVMACVLFCWLLLNLSNAPVDFKIIRRFSCKANELFCFFCSIYSKQIEKGGRTRKVIHDFFLFPLNMRLIYKVISGRNIVFIVMCLFFSSFFFFFS